MHFLRGLGKHDVEIIQKVEIRRSKNGEACEEAKKVKHVKLCSDLFKT